MTFHIALSTRAGSVLLSDSQGSTETSGMHGLQKQYLGDGFLLGGAGSPLILNALFDALSNSSGSCDPGAGGLAAFVEAFFEQEVRRHMLSRVELLLVTPDADGHMVQRFVPGVLTRFERRTNRGIIGSGADFAIRAQRRDRAIGVEWSMGSLADLLAFAHDCADAANESLTVNDEFLVSFLVGGRSYVMGDEAIQPNHIPYQIRTNWPVISKYYKEKVLPIVQSIRDTRGHAYRACSRLLAQEADPDGLVIIDEQLRFLADNLVQLRSLLADYFHLYDSLLGRPARREAPETS